MKISLSEKLKLIFIFILLGVMLVFGASLNAQSIMVSNQDRYMLELSDEEKAIKTSSSLIKAKTDITWETHINSIAINWKVSFNKDTKLYTLYKANVKYYESSTITGIRSKYASDLLGREITII